ncbi:hypothetical protein CBS101457_005401 [Exobasidium rhododendri]|nr:hypothetical protein CBS101457_005401 [Exobasidium rhododendri]
MMLEEVVLSEENDPALSQDKEEEAAEAAARLADLERAAAEELLTNLLQSKLGAKSLKDYLKEGQEAINAKVLSHKNNNNKTFFTTVDVSKKRPPPTPTLPIESEDKRCKNCGSPYETSLTPPSPSAPASSSPLTSRTPLKKVTGKGKGRLLHIDHNNKYVSQVVELQQAMSWPPVKYEHTREGLPNAEMFYVSCKLNGNEFQAGQGTSKLQQGKELAALQALKCLLQEA